MEPVTHLLTGACLGRAGLNRTTAYATLAATLAAEAPDIDVIGSFWGPVTGFAHHRGITHTLFGAPFMALAVTLIVYIVHRLRRKQPASSGAPANSAVRRVRWGWVWVAALLADFSHLLLDYTNSYGIRPFYPFRPQWHSWDIVYIFDPVLFLILLLALVLPALLGVVDREMTSKRTLYRGRGLAIAALVCMVMVWTLRNAEHAHAIAIASAQPPGRAPLLRVAAEPYPLDPFHWHVITETQNAYRDADVHTMGDRLDWDPDPIDKPPVTPAVAAAKQSYLGRVYLDWSSWPLTTDLGAAPIPGTAVPAPEPGWRTVEFNDMRFSYEHLAPASDRSPPLTGWVYLGPAGTIETEAMDGRVQH